MNIRARKSTPTPRFRFISNKSVKPIYPRTPTVLRELFAAVNEVPLTFFAVAASCAGSLIIWFYFKSIGYMPDDVAALIGLAIYVSGLSFLALAAFTVLSLLPATLLKSQKRQLSTGRTFLVFTSAYALLSAYFIVQNNELFLALKMLSASALILFLLSVPKTANSLKKELYSGGLIALMSFCPFLIAALVAQKTTSQFASYWLEWAAFIVVLAILTLINATLIRDNDKVWPKSKEREKWVGGFAITASFIVYFLALSPTGTFVNWAVGLVGIRLNNVAELVVPKDICETVLSQTYNAYKPRTDRKSAIECSDFGNYLKAEVKVRLGKSWLVCVRELNGAVADKPFTMTIPSQGIQLIVKNKSDATLQTTTKAVKNDFCNFSPREKSK